MPAKTTLTHGLPKKVWDGATPSAGLNSEEFALPSRVGVASHTVRWRYLFATNPSALSAKLQGSMNANAPSPEVVQWYDLDTKTTLTGDAGEIVTNSRFVRLRVETITGGAGITAEVMI